MPETEKRPITLDVDQPVPLTASGQPLKIHLLIRESGEYEDATTTVVAALTDEEQASLLMQVREEIEDKGDTVSYSIESVPLHPTAAAVLGVA